MRRASGKRSILLGWAIAASAAGLGSIATSRPAFAALRTFELAWTSAGSAAARGTLTLDDAICINPGNNSFAGGPDGCIVDLSLEVTGATTGNGRFTLDDLGDLLFNTGGLAIDYDLEVIGQSPSDINFFSAGAGPAPSGVDPFLMRPAGAPASDELLLVSMAPLPLPFDGDTQKCAGAIGKAGARYFAARHKVLQACRSALIKGTALFADEAKTVPVQVASACPIELKSAAKIAKARQKLRGAIEKKCSDAAVEALAACGSTLDALADATGAAGCLLDSIDGSVDDLLFDELGL